MTRTYPREAANRPLVALIRLSRATESAARFELSTSERNLSAQLQSAMRIGFACQLLLPVLYPVLQVIPDHGRSRLPSEPTIDRPA